MAKFTKNEMNFINSITLEQSHIPSLLLRHYTELGLSDRECLWLIAVINSVPPGNELVKAADLQNFLEISREEAEAIIAGFVNKGSLKVSGVKQIETAYSLKGLYEEMFELWVFLQACPKKANTEQKAEINYNSNKNKNLSPQIIKQTYSLFENEKGQPLTPTEIEIINHWLIDESWPAEMIKEALQRAVLHATCNLAYIDKILLRWQKDGIKTMEQLQAESTEFQQKHNKQTDKKQRTAKKKTNIMTNETDYNDIYNL